MKEISFDFDLVCFEIGCECFRERGMEIFKRRIYLGIVFYMLFYFWSMLFFILFFYL